MKAKVWTRLLKVGQRYDSNYRGNYRKQYERVIRGMGDKIIIETDSGVTLEIKAMKETGVGHIIDKLGTITEGIIEASATVGQGQVHE